MTQNIPLPDNTVNILGIETSCDDTSVCILRGNPQNRREVPAILSHLSFSQEAALKKWGGVVPEIAARNHLEKITPLLKDTFKEAGITPAEIDLIGVTTHPGLLGPLLTGLNAAKTLALIHKLPINPVNHLYAHLEAIHLTETNIRYPYLGLIVSGGHSLFMIVTSPAHFEIIGSTIDDAAGEAFDKGGKLMGLGYPGGRIIDDLAKEGDHLRFKFPIGLNHSKDANLSYSGVKTSLRQFVENNPQSISRDIKDLCASYQHAIVSALFKKMTFALKKAEEQYPDQKIQIVVGGGVACNSYLRKIFQDHFREVYFVRPSFCTDNGAMIANYALRTYTHAIPFSKCLYLDAKGKFIKKKTKIKLK